MREHSFGSRLLSGLAAKLVLGGGLLSIGSVIALSQGLTPAGNHVTVSLIGETSNMVPGRPFHVALRQQIQPGWHTYWVNPGESGLPTTISWSLPRDFIAGTALWPTPERFEAGPVVSYGYKGEVLLPISIDIPASVRPGSDVSLTAHIDWLACSDICVPEEADVSLSVPVGDASRPDPIWTDAFAAARAKLPMSNPFSTTATASKEEITLRITTGDASQLTGVIFFPEDSDVIDAAAAQSVTADSQGLSIVLRREKAHPLPSTLKGVLAYHNPATQADGASGAISISAPLQLSRAEPT